MCAVDTALMGTVEGDVKAGYVEEMDSTYISLFRTNGSTGPHCPYYQQEERGRCWRDG